MKDSKYYKKMLNRSNQKDRGWLNKLLLSIIVMLLCLIVTNFDSDIRESFTKNVLEENINFGYFNKLYKKFVGGNVKDETLIVSNTNLINYEEVDDSYKISISKEEGISNYSSGIIVYNGIKDNLGSTVIVQGNDGVDIWYSNMSLNGYSLYDYVSKGEILGNSLSDYYMITIVKDGEKIKYEEYFE